MEKRSTLYSLLGRAAAAGAWGNVQREATRNKNPQILELFKQRLIVLEPFADAWDECERQMNRWGKRWDDKLSPEDWTARVTLWAGKALAAAWSGDYVQQRRRWIQVAALALSAVAALDRRIDFEELERIAALVDPDEQMKHEGDS